MSETKNKDRVTDEGRRLGRNLVELIQPGLHRLAQAGQPDARCASCAFRVGTVPNGCPQTLADAFKACVEQVPFLCHAPNDGRACHGWSAFQVAFAKARTRPEFQQMIDTAAKMSFSPPDEE